MSVSNLTFNIEEVSVLDINDLIDKGQRFQLVTVESEEDAKAKNVQKVEEYLCQ